MNQVRLQANRFLREIRVTLGIEAGALALISAYALGTNHPGGYAGLAAAGAFVGFALLAARRPATSCIGAALSYIAAWLVHCGLGSMAFVFAVQSTAILALLLFVPLVVAGHAAWQLRKLGPDLDEVFR